MATVLVIDDEPDVLLLCRVNLEHAGHRVLEASDGNEGLAEAVSERPDAILLDVMLPEVDGFEVLTTLRSGHLVEVPVVLLTARARWEDQVKGWQAGAADYVIKPFSPASLVDAVERALRSSPEELQERRAGALRRLLGTDAPGTA